MGSSSSSAAAVAAATFSTPEKPPPPGARGGARDGAKLAERWIEMHKDTVLKNDTVLRNKRAAEAVDWLLNELNLSDHIRDLSEETPTVGLGDMLFRTPDMMVFNFLLILVGLALLSMCFELITDRIAKWKQKRFDEHIKKVQKMAFQVFEKDPFVEDAPPLGVRMAPNLMQIAATHMSEEKRGFLTEFKDWFAGKVTDNVIQSKLEDSDEDSEDEEHVAEEFEISHPISAVASNDLVVCSNGGASRRVSKHSYAFSDVSNLSNSKNPSGNNYGQLLDRIKAMEKFKPKRNDLDSRMFAKFLENKKLAKILEQTELRELATVSCQTDLSGLVVQRRNPKGQHARIGSVSSQSTMASFLNNHRHAPDDDSVMSITFGDLKFDYRTEPLIDEYHIKESNHSIFDFDDDDVIKMPQKMLVSRPGMPPPPPIRPSTFSSPLRALLEKEHKYDDNDREILMTPRRLASMSDIQARKVKIGYDENLQHARLVCGLLPQDFDSPSSSIELMFNVSALTVPTSSTPASSGRTPDVSGVVVNGSGGASETYIQPTSATGASGVEASASSAPAAAPQQQQTSQSALRKKLTSSSEQKWDPLDANLQCAAAATTAWPDIPLLAAGMKVSDI
uniref:Ion_trans_2 domain-containing protein n=1 Tax=Caenorhabditis japonica TaxID=281687 RepID=A0A8R1HYL8_CAEJA